MIKELYLVALILFALAVTVLSQENEKNDDDDSGESLNEVVVLLFLIVGLGIGIIVNQFLSIFGEYVPYTCLVFLLGMALSQAYKEDGKVFLKVFLFSFEINFYPAR